jgi:hypothetical protein
MDYLNFKKDKKEYVETEDLKRDIIAAASLSSCRKFTHEYLSLRIFGETNKKIKEIEEGYYQCLIKYAQVLNFLKKEISNLGNCKSR